MENDQFMCPTDIITGIVFIDGELAMLTLTADGELRWTEYGLRQYLSMKKDVLGFIVEGKQIRVKAVVEKEAGGICCGQFGGDFVRKDFVFEPLIDQNGWCYKLRQYLDSLGRPKRLLVFVNPFGGKKSAREIFVKEVKPLFEDADVQLEIQGSLVSIFVSFWGLKNSFFGKLTMDYLWLSLQKLSISCMQRNLLSPWMCQNMMVLFVSAATVSLLSRL
jgi:hypothetical protein